MWTNKREGGTLSLVLVCFGSAPNRIMGDDGKREVLFADDAGYDSAEGMGGGDPGAC